MNSLHVSFTQPYSFFASEKVKNKEGEKKDSEDRKDVAHSRMFLSTMLRCSRSDNGVLMLRLRKAWRLSILRFDKGLEAWRWVKVEDEDGEPVATAKEAEAALSAAWWIIDKADLALLVSSLPAIRPRGPSRREAYVPRSQETAA